MSSFDLVHRLIWSWCNIDSLPPVIGGNEGGEGNYAVKVIFYEHAFFQSVTIADIARSPIDRGDSEPIDQERCFRPVRRSLDEPAVGTHGLNRPSKQTDGAQVRRDLGWRTAESMVPAGRVGERNDDPLGDRRASDCGLQLLYRLVQTFPR